MKFHPHNFRPFVFGILVTLSLAFVIVPSSSRAISRANFDLKDPDQALISLNAPNAPDAPPTISIDDVSVTEGDTGTTDAIFSVDLSESYTDTVTVQYVTQNVTAIEPGDFISATGTITFPEGIATHPITITVNGDLLDEENETFSVILSNPTNAFLDDASGLGTITDDDSAGITVNPTSGLSTTEAGITDTFTISLTSQPTATVTIDLSSSDESEGTVSPSSLDFTTGDWDSPQTVTVSGVDDDLVDGDISYTIVTAPATSTDPNYSGLAVADVSVTNVDDDTAGISINPTSGLSTTEAGITDTFTISLTSQPTATVTIDLSSSDESEGTVAPASLTFTASDWDTAQEATVTGVDDDLVDGDIPFSIVTAPASSTDPNYSDLAVADVSVTNADDDTAGITVNPTSGLSTTEAGITDTFTISLTSQPTATVTIDLSNSDESEGTVSPNSLDFTTGDWDSPQTVTVSGVDDDLIDGDILYTIVTAPATSTDPNYSGLAIDDVSVTNVDDDTAGISVNPTSGLSTTEAGITATFTISLTSQPTATVTIDLSSSDESEGTISPNSLDFTTGDWDSPQTVTVSGVDDDLVDGDIPYTIVTAPASSTDPNYSGLNAADVSVTNVDDDTAGISVNPTSGLSTTEAGITATFTISLTSQPTATVTIDLSSSDESEGTVAPASLTFTASDWDTAQTVTVSGVDDDLVDGDIPFSIVTAPASSTDPNYSGVNAANVSVTNTDDDTAGITVSTISGDTTEAGDTATFTVVLDSEPTAPVIVYLVCSDPSEGAVSPSPLTFIPSDWDTAQTVTVTGVDDFVDDGDIPYTIQTTASSTDSLYNVINPVDVSVTNIDDDTAGVSISPTSGLTTTEAGGTATFTVALTSQPTTLVYVYVESSDSSEGIASPNPLSFTTVNWYSPQTVIVTGIDDPMVDGNISYSIQVTVSSVDTIYNSIDPADVSVTNTDDDMVGITVDPVSDLTTTEAGTIDGFTVHLDSQPIADVTIGLSSSDESEGTVSPISLTLTSENWNTPQVVTITGVDDAIIDGDIPYTIVTAPTTSTDPNYNNLDAADVSVTNADDDAAGITVNPTSGLITTEAGGTAMFNIVLNSQPTANVTITLSSSDTSEGTVSPTSATFTPSSWNVTQTMTITGVDDPVVDGAQAYTIITAAATSSDANFNGQNAPDVSVTNNDNDIAGVAIMPTSGLITSEAGASDTFTVVLNTQPIASVIIYLSSTDTTEGMVLPIRLTFTTTDWNIAQTVTVNGVDDTIVDGSQAYTIETISSSADPNYDAISMADISVTNSDDDTAEITVNPTSGLATSEAGGTASFTIVLTSQPTANVNIALNSSETSEGTVLPISVSFTPTNWDIPQQVTATGVDDSIDDGDIAYMIVTAAAVSSDGNFSGQNASDVAVTNLDNDSAGITVNPTSGLNTTEAGDTATFSIVLNSQPTSDVTITLSSSNTSEGTVLPDSVTLTSSNWNSPQTVTITGEDDDTVDGAQTYTIITGAAVSTDPNYSNRTVADVTVMNSDNDTASIIINPTSGLVTTEAGGTASFSVVLNSEPIASVIVFLDSTDLTEGTVSPDRVTFDLLDWDTPQIVIITGVDDAVMDGPQGYTIDTTTSSADSLYNAIDPSDVSVTNSDNDTAGITVDPTSGLNTTESGGTDNFTVVLDSKPTANVSLALSSSDTTEGTISPNSLVFTPANWNVLQTVTVTGVDDAVSDGDINYTINTAAATSSDGNYSGLNPSNVSITNSDDDAAGITVTPITGLNTTEAGGTAIFTIVLNSQPTDNVTIGVSSSNPSEGMVTPDSVTFTPSNWNSVQTVTITGIDDFIMDGSQAYTIITAAATSTDLNFAGQNAPDVSVTNADNDMAGVTIAPITGLTTSESGNSDTFTIVLSSQPIASVFVLLNSSDTSEGIVTLSLVTFEPADWDIQQTAIVTGVDDVIVDGPQAYMIETSTSSADTNYDAIDPVDVSVTNTDNDSAGIIVDPISGLITTEAGGSDVFSVVLGSQPTANVTIGLSSSDLSEGTVAPTEVVFTTNNWDSPQNVTVTGVDDTIDDGDIVFSIITDAASSSDSNFSGQNPPDVAVTNSDDDGAGITINPLSGLNTTETGGSDSFTVVLDSQPTSNVSIVLTSSDTSEGTISPNSLTFTNLNWSVPQATTVIGVDDSSDDGDISYTIITDAASSTDLNYSGQNPSDVSVINHDDDTTPTAVEDIYITNSGPFTVTVPGVLSNDTDLDGDTLIAVLEGDVDNGSLTLNADGSFEYTPDPFFTGKESFAYVASDGTNISNIVDVEITVDQVDPTVEWVSPVETGNTLFVTNETLLLTANASDNLQIDRVRFRRWDAINNEYVELGIVSTPPYQIYLDTTSLNYGFNQIFVEAYDTAENKSVRQYIWLFRQAIIYLPLVIR